jgi:hypothetical protein
MHFQNANDYHTLYQTQKKLPDKKNIHYYSVADPDSGSVAFLTPGPGIQNGYFPDPGSRIPTHIFESLVKILGKKFYNSLITSTDSFLQHFKNKIIFNFVKFVATKKGMTTIFFTPHLLLLFLDLGWVKLRIRVPGSRIRNTALFISFC